MCLIRGMIRISCESSTCLIPCGGTCSYLAIFKAQGCPFRLERDEGLGNGYARFMS